MCLGTFYCCISPKQHLQQTANWVMLEHTVIWPKDNIPIPTAVQMFLSDTTENIEALVSNSLYIAKNKKTKNSASFHM